MTFCGGSEIDYYGVTFDHLVPPHDLDPEVLQIDIIEMDDDEGAYANTHLPVPGGSCRVHRQESFGCTSMLSKEERNARSSKGQLVGE